MVFKLDVVYQLNLPERALTQGYFILKRRLRVTRPA